MRRLVLTIDQLPAWQFVVSATVLLAMLKAWWNLAGMAGNPGAVELGGILTLGATITLSVFAIRRRQTGVWDAAAQVLLALALANVLALVFVWPFLPPELPLSFTRVVRAGLSQSFIGAALAVPVQAGGLWLSRRYGSHSAVTERRLREIAKHRPERRAVAASDAGQEERGA